MEQVRIETLSIYQLMKILRESWEEGKAMSDEEFHIFCMKQSPLQLYIRTYNGIFKGKEKENKSEGLSITETIAYIDKNWPFTKLIGDKAKVQHFFLQRSPLELLAFAQSL